MGLLKEAISRWKKEIDPRLREAIHEARAAQREILESSLWRDKGLRGFPLSRAERAWQDALFQSYNPPQGAFEYGRRSELLGGPHRKGVPIPPVLEKEEWLPIWEKYKARNKATIPGGVEQELFETLGAGRKGYHKTPFKEVSQRWSPKGPAAEAAAKTVEQSLLRQYKTPLAIAGALSILAGLGLGASHLFGGMDLENQRRKAS